MTEEPTGVEALLASLKADMAATRVASEAASDQAQASALAVQTEILAFKGTIESKVDSIQAGLANLQAWKQEVDCSGGLEGLDASSGTRKRSCERHDVTISVITWNVMHWFGYTCCGCIINHHHYQHHHHP